MNQKSQAILNKFTLSGTGEGTWISHRANIDKYAYLVEIGDHVTIMAAVWLLCHDAMGRNHDGRTKYGRIIIGDRVSIGVGAILLPAIRIGKGSIIAAGAVVYSGSDIPPSEVWAGNPAKKVCTVAEYLKKRKSIREVTELGKGTVNDLECVFLKGK